MAYTQRTFDQLIDFTRTTAGTYVDSTGKIVSTPASRNLLTFTQEFDNAAWGKAAVTVTANTTTAPDGTLTADTVTADGTTAAHVISQASAASATGKVFSVYAKAGTNPFLQVYFTVDGGPWANFDLSNGTVGSTGTGTTASITAVGNGWYRCVVAITSTTAGNLLINIVPLATSTRAAASALTTSVILWGAQLEAVPDANLVLGSERWTNSGVIGMSATIAANGAGWDVTATGTSFVGIRLNTTSFGTSTYRTTVSWSGNVNGRSIVILVGGGQVTLGTSASGSATVYIPSTNSTTSIQMYATTATVGETFTFTVSSVKEITGTTGMPTDYTRNVGGLFPPRFDYDPVTLAPKGLLVEEQRTNLLVRSEEFDNASWTKIDVTATANATVSPDGTADADKLIATAVSGTHYVAQSTGTLTASSVYTFTVFAKAGEYSHIGLTGNAANSNYAAQFNLATGTLVTSSNVVGTPSVTSFGNGWYRLSVSFTCATASGGFSYVQVRDNSNAASYTGDGTSGIYVWGAQLEAGAFATSYIPTVASQVTRTADVATITGANFSQWFNAVQGTFVVEASLSNAPSAATSSLFAASDNTNNERIYVGTGTGSGGNINAVVTDGGVLQAQTINGSVSSAGVYKYANAYALNDFASALGGGAAVTDTAGTLPTVDRLYLGASAVGAAPLNGHVRSIRYYPSRLTNAQLQALTA